MSSIAVVGPPGIGKSTLCFNLEKYLEKQGLDASIANADYFCKHITYKPDYDVRDNKDIRKAAKKSATQWPKFYQSMFDIMAKDHKLSALREKGLLILDFSVPLECLLLFQSQSKSFFSLSDRVVLLGGENFRTRSGTSAIRAVAALLENVSGRQVVPVLNRPGLEKPERARQATLLESILSPDRGLVEDVLEVNAVERVGFRELARELRIA